MHVGRCLSFVFATALFGLSVGHAAELAGKPSRTRSRRLRNRRPNIATLPARPAFSRRMELRVRMSGYIATGVSAGQIK